MLGIVCPKCGSRSTWLEWHDAKVLRCLCGLHKYIDIESKREAHIPTLPGEKTSLYACLRCFRVSTKDDLSTSEIIQMSSMSKKKVSAMLVALENRGLIRRVLFKKGVTGGSVWTLESGVLERIK